MSVARKVAIVGGGIGGLTLAVALRRVGIDVRIIEKGNRAGRLGTGISLLGNALRALDKIGMADPCIAAGFGYDSVKTFDAAGNFLQEMQPPRTFSEDRPGAFGIMRVTLADTLERAAIELGAVIDFDTTVTDFAQHPDRVELTLSSGEQMSVDLLVGADGAYSAIRDAIFPEAPTPEYCGQGGIRLTAPRPEAMDAITFYRAQTGEAVGAIPLSSELCYYFVLISGERLGFLDERRTAEIWKQRMTPFSAAELARSAEALKEDSPISYRPFDVLMMPLPWHVGRVVLLGDAAHSMSPQLTSGGGMAIEDAVVLADILAGSSDLESALVEYETRREARVRPILETSLGICRIEQAPSFDAHQKSMALLSHGYDLLAAPF